jgi:HEAT repeat protein
MAAGQDSIFLALREGIQAFDWTSGLEVCRMDLPGKNRIDVHGSVLVASTTPAGKLHAVEAKTGLRLWSADVGAYSLFDGKLYSVSLPPESKPPELLLVCYHVPTGRELWRRHYDVPLVQKKPVVLSPAVSFDEILVVCDRNLLQLKRETGELLAKQTLAADVTQPVVATPGLVYLSGVGGKLTAYDLTNNLTQVWELPTSGKEVVSLDSGTLYVLDKEELKAYRGEKQNYSAEHLKALAHPTEQLQGVAAETLREAMIRPAPFIAIGSIRDKKELMGKLDDKRLSDIAFYQLLNVGQLRDWKMMIEETLSMKAPGERKMRVLTEAELRMLYAEMIQRHEPMAMELVKDALRSGVRNRTQMVIELMATGDRATYGPVLVQVFRDALKNKQYMTAVSCAEAVGSWQHEPGLPLLIQGLSDDKAPDNVRSACAEGLAMFDNPEAIRAFVRVARDDARPALSKQCTEFLVQKGEEGIKAVGAILADPSASERSRIDAAAAFAKAKGPEAIPHLLSALNNEHHRYASKVQAAAAASLGPLSSFRPEVLTALVSQMNNAKNDAYLRNACMAGLAASKNPAAIPHLIAVMGDKDVDNRKFTSMSAYQFLVLMTGEKTVGQYPEEWRQWWEKNKDRFAEKP